MHQEDRNAQKVECTQLIGLTYECAQLFHRGIGRHEIGKRIHEKQHGILNYLTVITATQARHRSLIIGFSLRQLITPEIHTVA